MFNSCCHYKETEQKALGTLCNKEQHVFWPDSVWAIIKPNYCSFWKPKPLCHHSALHQRVQMLIPLGPSAQSKQVPGLELQLAALVTPFQ